MVADALTAGIVSTGVNVARAGIIPTPTLAYSVEEFGYSAGLMITASHNPPEYTGIKFWNADTMGFTPEMERELERIYLSKEFQVASWDSIGNVTQLETAVDHHISSLIERCDHESIRKSAFRVIVDPGNGAACVLAPYLMRKLGCKVITINGQLDGHFPGRKSEPEEESLGDLIRMVKGTGADLGIAHDGDSDRVVFVTETGEVVRGDRTIALFASEAPVGDIQVAIKIKEQKAVHGGEACGVYLFPEFHLAPEPFLASCKILELMAKTGKPFGQMIGDIPVYPLLKSKIRVPNEKKVPVMEILKDELPKAMGDVKEVITVDGLGISLEQGWVLVRPSGTEPVIRITCEAPTNEIAQKILENAKGAVQKVVNAQ
jgi:phosphomannomutase